MRKAKWIWKDRLNSKYNRLASVNLSINNQEAIKIAEHVNQNDLEKDFVYCAEKQCKPKKEKEPKISFINQSNQSIK